MKNTKLIVLILLGAALLFAASGSAQIISDGGALGKKLSEEINTINKTLGDEKFALEQPAWAWSRLSWTLSIGIGLAITFLARSALRLHGHFHDEHYRPIVNEKEVRRKPVQSLRTKAGQVQRRGDRHQRVPCEGRQLGLRVDVVKGDGKAQIPASVTRQLQPVIP